MDILVGISERGINMSQKVCEYLRWLKESGNYTHQRLSDLTGIPYGTIPKYFSGLEDESASFEIVRKLVMAMGGSLDKLAGIRPKSVETNSNKMTEDGFAESEIKVTNDRRHIEMRGCRYTAPPLSSTGSVVCRPYSYSIAVNNEPR